ncbi:nitric oxide reductase transcriptional regulator NorR [Desulfopila sp. IMCC35008]|uniref:nitric oxide reductase transcriptional regulator NorR n=1 Tax=Desulfopila sp. IMCC35008 TaxID=2653858 RepID=UPI0013D8C91D|nr:nitric oxide reductase transcriptional regulator NorR [Desulfopila sp. IMCC35008]
MDTFQSVTDIALDLTADLSADDRYDRLLRTLHRVIPFDAATLLQVKENKLTPLAAVGLTPDAMGRIYDRKEHPRLDIICNSDKPVLFSKDSMLPDPFDGMIVSDPQGCEHIHACLGCPLYVHDKLVGVLTADALNPEAFDRLSLEYLQAVASLAGAQMQTAILIEALEKQAERQGQIATNLMQDVELRRGCEILGQSPSMLQLRKEIELVAKSDFTVLILGETGVGKELVTRAIQRQSRRSEKAMLYLNCAALPETLAESELFGHVKGAFTGATQNRAGKFELADGGTLFLDEIGELSLEIQAKLLRAIQEGEIQRVGSETILHADVRLLAATNRDLEYEVKQGKFRADLYHRLNVYPITVPPLRDRKDDIAILSGFFITKAQKKMGLQEVRISETALQLLKRYNWPGNVRELENIISRAVLKVSRHLDGNTILQIRPEHLAGDLGSAMYVQPVQEVSGRISEKISFRDEVKRFQINLIQTALEKRNGNWAAAARDLDMNRSNLHNLATRLGIRQRRQ